MSYFVLEELVKAAGVTGKVTSKWFNMVEAKLQTALTKKWSVEKVVKQILFWDKKHGLSPSFFTAGLSLYLQYYFAFGKKKLEGPTSVKGSDANVLSILDEFKAWLGQELAQTASAPKLAKFYNVLYPRLASNPELVSELEGHYQVPQSSTQMGGGAGAVESKAVTPPRHEVVAPLRPELAALQAKLVAAEAKRDEALRKTGEALGLGRSLTEKEGMLIKAYRDYYREHGLPTVAYVDPTGVTSGR